VNNILLFGNPKYSGAGRPWRDPYGSFCATRKFPARVAHGRDPYGLKFGKSWYSDRVDS